MVTPIVGQAPLSEGSEFADRYRIERVIAHGDRKWTYLASDMKARGHRQVALAIMEPGPASAASEREVEMMGKVGPHDCVVTLHDFDLDAPRPFLVYEYLPGGRLRDHCRDLHGAGSQVPMPDVFRTARQLCRALAHVHGRGVIHRDVAATNILLDERGVPHLGDFDSAVSVDEIPDALVAFTPEGLGAPELLNGAAFDHRADLFALGAVLYEVLVGAPPVTDSPIPMLLPSQVRADVPPSMDRLILSLLAADPDERPDSAQAVLDDIREIERAADLELLIATGESASLEFKQTLRWDATLQKRNAELVRASMKTVCAFLNSGGGTLLIGVADTGEPKGLADDLQDFQDKKTVDGFELRFREALSTSVSPNPNQLVTLSFPYVHGIQICRVNVSQSAHPVFLVSKNRPTELVVRRGNASEPLSDIRQAIEYAQNHWK